jgi:hypothetical protein
VNKNIQRIIFTIPFAILCCLIFKYFGFQVTLITVLVMIYIELFIGSDKK